MDMNGQERIGAPVETVWRALNNPDMLKACIPGCETLEKQSDTNMSATVVLKVGPIKARFEGAIELSNLNAPHGYTISGEGKGGIAGFAKGRADVSLAEDGPGATLLTYTVKADVGGKIAQLGQRLIDGVAKSMAEDFFKRFDDEMQRQHPEAYAAAAKVEAASPPPAAGAKVPAWAWAVGAAVALAALWLLAR